MSRQMDLTLRWSDIAWLRDHWPGKVLVKGILSADDARLARESGVDGIVVSNHGGRQLESAPSPLQQLPAVVAAAGPMAVLLDGGVRRGADIAKARALGAQAVLLGRAPLYGLAARGPAGATEVLTILRTELEIVLRLIGRPRVQDVDATALTVDWAQRLQRV
jgi:(S)-mandelate dehydrogenase